MASLKTYALPAALALAQACGLILALISDGPWEWLAWVLVGAPGVIFSALLLRGLRKRSGTNIVACECR